MARLIYADELRNEMHGYVFPITTNNLMGAADVYYRILHILDDMPTVDAAPVVHGEWKHHENGIAYCSECGVDAVEDGTNYCPNCGADMRRGRWKGEGMGDYSCSLCGEVVSGNHRKECPNCHAKMDGGDKE